MTDEEIALLTAMAGTSTNGLERALGTVVAEVVALQERVAHLERDLAQTRDTLQVLLDERTAAVEYLRRYPIIPDYPGSATGTQLH